MSQRKLRYYKFLDFKLDILKNALWQGECVVPLASKAVQLLHLLAENQGELVDKDEIFQKIWADTHITDANLSQTIYLLRKIVGTHAIVNVPKRGYLFAVDVEEIYEDELVDRGESSIQSLGQVNCSAEVAEGSIKVNGRFTPVLQSASSYLFKYGHPLPIILFIFVTGATITLFWIFQSAIGRAIEGEPADAIAVLPFKTIGASQGQEYLGLGTSDVIITKLSTLQRLQVRPTSVIFRYVDKPVDPVAAGRELKVKSVLDGTVQRTGEQVRVSVRLIRVSDGKTIWAEIFDEKFVNVFSVQDVIAERIAISLGLNLNSDERKAIASRGTQNLEAYDAYVRGIYLWNLRSKEALEKSIKYFSEAIEKDPNYAQAYASLADAYAQLGIRPFLSTMSREEAYEKVKGLVNRAIELNPGISDAYSALFVIEHFYKHRKDEAEKAIKRALELNRNNVTARTRYGLFLRDYGDLDRAIEEYKLAQQIDPLLVLANSGLCEAYYLKRDYHEALNYCRKGLEISPEYPPLRILTGRIYIEQNRFAEALEIFRHLPKNGHPLCCYATVGYLYAKAGQKEKIPEELHKLRRQKPTTGMELQLAILYSLMGDNEKALHHIQKEDKDLFVSYWLTLQVDPRLYMLRQDKRFQDWLAKQTP